MTFRLFAKISVKGKDQHPLYKYLTDKKAHKKTGGPIRWNFDKFLIDTKGQPVGRYGPQENPMGKKIVADVEKALTAVKVKKKRKTVRL